MVVYRVSLHKMDGMVETIGVVILKIYKQLYTYCRSKQNIKWAGTESNRDREK